MPSGSELRDRFGVGRHLEARIVRYEEDGPPVPFRGFTDGSDECLPFFEEMEAALTSGSERIWNITGPSGCGKTTLARAAVVAWGRRFLAEPDRFPAVLQANPPILRKLVENEVRFERALLRASLPRAEAEALSSQGVGHPILFILDKDETAGLEDWKVPLLPWNTVVHGNLATSDLDRSCRILHLALEHHLPGPRTRIAGWEGETALLAAHALGGEEGVARWKALADSPVAELLSYPLFVSWLLKLPSIASESIARGAVVLDFIRWMHSIPRTRNVPDLPEWCEKLLWKEPGSDPLAFRKLHVGSSGWGRVFEGGLTALALRWGRIERVLRCRVLEAESLEMIASIVEQGPLVQFLESHTSSDDVVLTNVVNLLWRVKRSPLPDRFLKHVFRQVWSKRASRDATPSRGAHRELLFLNFLVHLQGYRFAERLANLDVSFADLTGATIEEGAESTTFRHSALRESRIQGSVRSCSFTQCRFGGAHLGRATFQDCRFRELGFPRGCLSGESRFAGCLFRDVSFGPVSGCFAIVFEDCELAECNLKQLAPGGLVLPRCRLRNLSMEGCVVPRFEAPKAAFRHCDLEGFRSSRADLSRTLFERCILANASLRGADLRSAQLIEVDFQPGPGSRSGLTALPTRTDALHGSKSGFYAQDISEGVYLDRSSSEPRTSGTQTSAD
jgi:uncharacterized protein YjbI with pentapeptide repeats